MKAARAPDPERGRPLKRKELIKVGLFGGSRLVRDRLSHGLRKEPGISCHTMTLESRSSAIQPDIILVDSDRVTGLDHLLEAFPNSKLVVTNADAGELNVVDCARRGVVGFTLKEADAPAIVEAICAVANGGRVIPAVITQKLVDQLSAEPDRTPAAILTEVGRLTVREQKIARLMAEGLSNKEIADKLHVALNTVKSHVHSILQKLPCRNRAELAALVMRR